MSTLDQFRITDPEVAKCPFDYYKAMRRDAPVHQDPGTGFWWISRYEDVTKATFDVEHMSSKSDIILRKSFRPRAQALWDAAGMVAIDTLVTGDPPEHTDYRAVGMQLFNPKKVEAITPAIQTLVEELVDAFAERGEVDFITEFAAKLPGTVVCDEFGLPRQDQPKFKAWTDAIIGLLAPDVDEDTEVELVKRVITLFQYLESHILRAADEPSGRVIHALATVPKRDGTPFSNLERAWMAVVTFVGGNETTMNMLAAGMRKLALDSELQDSLRADPAKVPGFVEELLRLEGSVQSLLRVAPEEFSMHGVTIPKGANIVLCTGAANRDEQRWPHADQFIPDRPDARRHLTFGHGPHTCIGMHLARRELAIAFTVLLQRLDSIRLAVPAEDIQQLPLPFHRAIANLPLRFESRAA